MGRRNVTLRRNRRIHTIIIRNKKYSSSQRNYFSKRVAIGAGKEIGEELEGRISEVTNDKHHRIYKNYSKKIP